MELRRVRDACLAPTLSLALNQHRIAYAALTVLTLVRLTVAAAAPLAPDEAYYWVFSHALAPGYLDHPPMVALWVRAGTLVAGQTELGVRLLGPLSVALGSVLLMDAADRLLPGRHAGIAAATLLNATLLLGVGSAIMTPDTPLLFFWVAALWATARLLHSGRGAWWLAIGAFAGLALASKYTAAFLWIGIGLWLCWVPSLRRWWASVWLWAGTALGGLVFLPVVLWNAAHHWASFVRQGGRVEDWHPARAAQFLGELVGGQFGLATPLLFVLFVAGVALAARRAWRSRDPAWSLLAALTLPAAVVFVQHAFGDRVQGNWPAILYPAAAIAAAGLDPPRWTRWQAPAVAVGLAFTALVYIQAVTFVLPLPARLDPIARELGGWDTLARDVSAASQRSGAVFVAAGQYGVASELAWALPTDLPVVDDDPRWAFTTLPRLSLAGRTGILVQRARDREPLEWANAVPLNQVMGGRFRLWRVTAADTKATRLPARR
ncbi:MAG TPA: glycosyltransferase family 39 protein [Acetobacteraceae bacterium]